MGNSRSSTSSALISQIDSKIALRRVLYNYYATLLRCDFFVKVQSVVELTFPSARKIKMQLLKSR